VKNPPLEVVKHADLLYMEEVELWEVTHDTENVSKHVKSSVKMARQEFDIGCLGVVIVEHLILVLILPGVLPVRRDIISKFCLWTLRPKTDMPLTMM